MRYDIIGDVHGHSNDLKVLLKKMGYGKSEKGFYYHPYRQAIFIGDYIDRGKNSKEVYQIVKDMQQNNSAIALMGNHEYNAICFHTKDKNDNYLRKRSNKNIKQHCATLQSFDDNELLKEAVSWFKQLPLFFENEHLRAIHACWDQEQIDFLSNLNDSNYLNMNYLEESANEGTNLFKAVEIVLKGQEIDLPLNITFLDKDKHERNQIRIKWWENPVGKSYKEVSVKMEDSFKDLTVAVPSDKAIFPIYGNDEKPVFFGHYWLEDVKPKLQKPNVCCLDYSVAKKGKLVAYRFDGESVLNENKFCW